MLIYVYMRKITLLFVLFTASLAIAGNRHVVRGVGHGDYHFGYVSVSGGYTSLSQNVENVTTKGSWGALLGAGYEFRMSNGWCSVGVQFMQEQSTTTPDEYVFNTPYGGVDNQVPPQRIEYFQYTIRQTDQQLWRTVDIPLMAGYYNSGFYVGAGMKVGFSVGSSITTGGQYDLGAKYEKYAGILRNVNIYRTYEAADQKYDCKLRPQFSLIGEVGYDLLSSMMSNSTVCHMLKIGFYAECGLRSVRPVDSLDPIQLQGMNMADAALTNTDVTKAHMTPYYLSTQTEGKKVMPFYVGVKLTYLIGGSWSTTRTWHKGCQCYDF